MAATLLAIKSRMLLPIHEGEMDEAELDVDGPDPRDELVTRLIEYRKYKEAAAELQILGTERAQVYSKPPTDLSEFMPEEQMVLFDTNVNVYDMLGAFQKLMRRKQLKKPLQTRVARQEISVKDQMRVVINVLKGRGGKAMFSDLFPYEDKSTLVLTFLTLLELMKRQVVFVEQQHNFEDLTVLLQKEDIGDELEQLDEQD
jgi:segregation and condensation protein A